MLLRGSPRKEEQVAGREVIEARTVLGATSTRIRYAHMGISLREGRRQPAYYANETCQQRSTNEIFVRSCIPAKCTRPHLFH